VTNTLPTAVAFELITEAAAELRCNPEDVQATLDHFDGHDIAEVLEAIQDLGTFDASILSAYLSSTAMLDDQLDGWLEVG
jgi:hypothetical protein